MTENANTTAGQLIGACEIGRNAGLRYVYAGTSLPRSPLEHYCPNCDELLIERYATSSSK